MKFESNSKDMPTNNIIKVVKGRAELRKVSGSLIRTIGGDDTVHADLKSDNSMVLLTRANGRVELRKEGGSLIRTIGNGDAVSARFHGDDILVQTNKGKTELRKEGGSLIRTI